MEVFIEEFKAFFNSENIKHIWEKSYEWFDLTLKTIFGRIPYDPIRDLFINPWFWFILFFIIITALIFRRK